MTHICKGNSEKGTPRRRRAKRLTPKDPEYWEARLVACGLGMDTGHNTRYLQYWPTFGSNGLDFDGRDVYLRGEKSKRSALQANSETEEEQDGRTQT